MGASTATLLAGRRARLWPEELRAAATDFRVKEQRVADLLKEARCRETSEFEAAEARSVACQGCRERLAAVERFLLENGDGLPVTVLEAEAAAVSPDELPAVLTEVNGRLEELQSRRQELNTEIGEENAELRRMDGSSAAAEAEEQVQAALASLRGSQVHSSVILSSVDEGMFKRLGMNVTFEPVYQSHTLYHK